MPSFDIVSEINKVELNNSIEQSNKEIANRFDFKGSDARIEFNDKELQLVIYADDDFKLSQVKDILISKMTKRGVDVKIMLSAQKEKLSSNKVKEIIKLLQGVSQENAKKIIKIIKDSNIKVQGSIQGDLVRVNGSKKDDLQNIMQVLRKDVNWMPLQFNNLRN